MVCDSCGNNMSIGDTVSVVYDGQNTWELCSSCCPVSMPLESDITLVDRFTLVAIASDFAETEQREARA